MHPMLEIMKRFFLLLYFTLGMFGTGCQSADSTASTPPPKAAASSPNELVLTPEQVSQLGIQSIRVVKNGLGIPISVQGKAIPNHHGTGVVSAPISGRIIRLYAHQGQMVRKGQVVAELESLEFATLAAEYLQAESDLHYRKLEWERLQALYEKNLVPQSEVQRAEAEKMRATTQIRVTETKLTATGIGRSYLQQWASRKIQQPTLPVYALVSGMVNTQDVQIGQSVVAYAQMMTLIPTTEVMVEAFVSPEQAPRIQVNDEATVRLQGQTEVIRMTVVGVQATMDEARHAVRVLLESQTLNGFPKPGQLVQVEFSTLVDDFATQIPLSAIEYEGDDAHVFVQKAENRYERRPVKVLRLLGDAALISEGLQGDETIAITQVFTLKSLSRLAEFAE